MFADPLVERLRLPPSPGENLEAGRYAGVPLLQLSGMSCEPRQAAEKGVAPFPHMLRWVR
jgi:hypothetical protein